MNSFNRAYEDFTWVTMHLLQTSWENGNIRLTVNQFMKLEETVKDALKNFKTILEVYNRTPRRSETFEVGLNDGDGSIRFLPYQKTILVQLKMDAKVLIREIEEKSQEGFVEDALDAYVRGVIKAWKEHAGMAMLNQMMEERGNPLEMFPDL